MRSCAWPTGIMIARGDLGVQLPTEEIPLVQKRLILKCHEQNKASSPPRRCSTP